MLSNVLVTFLIPLLAGAASPPADCLHNGFNTNTQDLFVPGCIDTCRRITKKTDTTANEFFAANCRRFAERNSNPADTLLKMTNQALIQCLPLAVRKAVEAPVHFILALPQLLSYVLNSGDEGMTSDEGVKWSVCERSPECLRALARNTLRFENASDPQIDQALTRLTLNDLLVTVANDHEALLEGCNRLLGDVRTQVDAAHPPDDNARAKRVFDEIARRRPVCTGTLRLTPPVPTVATQNACFKANPNPYECLSIPEKIAAGLVCMGPEFEKGLDRLTIEFCADVASVIVPLPLIGPQTKLAEEAAAIKGGETVTKASPEVVEGVQVVKLASPERAAFVQKYTTLIPVSSEQNARFIALVEDSGKLARENRTRIFDGENSVMKTLNDTTRDKNLVTSLTNRHKELLLQKIEELRRKYPDMQFELYSDFKSVKIAVRNPREFDPALSDRLRADLDSVFQQTNREFAAEMEKLGISVPAAGKPDHWFKAGYGRNVDEAALAARRARLLGGESHVLDYYTPEVRDAMTARLKQMESLRAELARSPAFKPLFSASVGSPAVPQQAVFDLVRKSKTPEDLAAAIRSSYGLKNFSTAEAARLQEYVRGVDEFSPTLLIGKRENANLDQALNGGLSADFIGMGSANLHATALGIAGKTDLPKALLAARRGEQQVTKTFAGKMAAFRRIVGGQVICSGDDCVRVASTAFSDREKLRLVSAVAGNSKTRGVRIAFVGPGVPSEFRMQLAAQGESLEKTLRQQLTGVLSPVRLKQLTFGLDMQTVALSQGTVNLIVGRGSQAPLTLSERAAIQQAFARALEKNNTEVSAYIQGTTQTSDSTLFLLPGTGMVFQGTSEP
jgi:hypothetical protein